MAYIIYPKERAPAAVCRIVLEQNRRALALLRDVPADPAARIHRSRQCFKRMRAALRLIRDAAPYVYEVENRFYRDIGRRLSRVRDTEAIVEAVGVLEISSADPALRESLAMLKTGFRRRAEAKQLEFMTGLTAGTISGICDELRAANDRLTRLPLRGLRKRHLKRAARKTVRKCAQIFRQVRAVDDPEAFHAWRRHVKAAYHHARLMQELRPAWSNHYESPLRELAELLGQMQNLCALNDALRSVPDELGIDIHLQRLRRAINLSYADLRDRTIEIGDAVFDGHHSPEPRFEVISFPARPAG